MVNIMVNLTGRTSLLGVWIRDEGVVGVSALTKRSTFTSIGVAHPI
jgi:hypothetical protein